MNNLLLLLMLLFLPRFADMKQFIIADFGDSSSLTYWLPICKSSNKTCVYTRQKTHISARIYIYIYTTSQKYVATLKMFSYLKIVIFRKQVRHHNVFIDYTKYKSSKTCEFTLEQRQDIITSNRKRIFKLRN